MNDRKNLREPDHLLFNGEIVDWSEATVHVWSEMAIRGTSIFEGVRAYWNTTEQRYGLMADAEHRRRMVRSAAMLRVPATRKFVDEIFDAIPKLLDALDYREDVYIRPTLYLNAGRYGYRAEDVELGSYVVVFPSPRLGRGLRPAKAIVSSWRRLSDLAMSPAIKTGGAYQSFRLPLIEAKEAGCDDAILLNEVGFVAETCGACLFLVRDGTLITPSVTSGILESVTRAKLIELARDLGIPVEERDVLRSELQIADEIFSCGTLAELVPFTAVDHFPVGDGTPGPITRQLCNAFNSVVESSLAGNRWLTAV